MGCPMYTNRAVIRWSVALLCLESDSASYVFSALWFRRSHGSPTVIALSLSLSLVCLEPGERELAFFTYFPQDVTRCDDAIQAGGHCKYTSRSRLTYPSPPS